MGDGRKGKGAQHQGPTLPARVLEGVGVLVVENDRASAKLEQLLLELAGAVVRVAANAEEAMRLVQETTPDLIVLDLFLPQMSGLVLAEILKRQAATGDIVIVAVTSLSGPEGERIVKEAGCDGYLTKPIDTDTFAAALASTLWGAP